MFKSLALQRFGVFLLGRTLDATLRTMRWTIEGEAHLIPFVADVPVVAAFWHQRLALMPALWRHVHGANGRREGAVLVSRNRDGRFIGDILAYFHVAVVHGSSAKPGKAAGKGGVAAALQLQAVLARGGAVVITPDGPRGPARVAAPGVAHLASLSGAPVLPAAAACWPRITLNSWDRMMLPIPFGRGVLVCLPPVAVAPDAAEASLPTIAAALDAAAARADALCGCRPAGTLWALAATLAAPALRVMLARRAARGKEIAARLPERFGVERSARPAGKLVWLHAASVGEMVSMLPVLPLLPAKLSVLFTTGTVTSATLLDMRLDEASLAARVTHRFVPLDVPRWIAAFLDHWQPDAACFVESELWPNMLAACRARAIPMGLINARLSERSTRRWRLAGAFLAELLSSFRWIAAQSEADAIRLRKAGAARVTAPGNLKLAAPPLGADQDVLDRLKILLLGRKIWLAASTHPGEEEIALEVHRALVQRHPGLLTIVVPRHPGRGEAIAKLLGGAPRWSLRQDPPAQGFWVGDTIGELGLFYRLSPIVFIGKSLRSAGGQNPWEPARLSCAIATGPNTANFADAVQALAAAGGLTTVQDAAALTAWVGRLLDDPAALDAQRQAAAAAALATAADLPAQIAAMIAGLAA
jgi:3-deoxy-D-manno-octulosonic-acid transferase